MSWHTSRRSSELGAPATSAKTFSFHPRLLSAKNVVTSGAPNARASQRSYRSGLLVILETWKLIAIPKLRNNWKSLDARGGSHVPECVGSAKNVMHPLSMGHHCVLVVVTSAVTSAPDHRKYPLKLCTVGASLILYRNKKTKDDENYDPRLVAAVEAKLRALDVDSDALNSGLEAA
jgi:hypothetical protein